MVIPTYHKQLHLMCSEMGKQVGKERGRKRRGRKEGREKERLLPSQKHNLGRNDLKLQVKGEQMTGQGDTGHPI